MKKKVLVGMSGGVDSSVAALLLIEQGYEVTGVTMEIWGSEYSSMFTGIERSTHACFGPGEEQDLEDARSVARALGIRFLTIDVKKEYHEHVIDYFKNEYLAGRTPNPCVRCNHRIKFGYLLTRARASGLDFDFFATGHYAIQFHDETTGRYGIRKAHDLSKDQSYFLSFLEQHQLRQIIFPLGSLLKSTVREKAHSIGLPVSSKKESQDFIERGDYSVLFKEKVEPGPILDVDGKLRGTHRGIIHYTVGQRRGIGVADRIPLYVIRIDRESNSIVVGPREKLFSSGLTAHDVNWILIPNLQEPIKAKARIRLAHREAPATLTPAGDGSVKVDFTEPQKGITPGQVVVFYDDDRVLGGGIIGDIR